MIGYNPCGAAVEWLSDTYETPCRFSNDPAAPLVTLVWEWTDQDFLPGEQVINSKHWCDASERGTVIGEQWDYPPRTIPRDIPIGLLGGHQCGTADDFANGEEWPYTGDPVEYDEDDVPLCCPRYYGLTVGAHPESDVSSGPVEPFGLTCCLAPVQPINTLMGASVAAGETISHFWRFVLPAGHWVITGFTSPGVGATVFTQWGPACDDTPNSDFPHDINGDWDFTIATASTVCFHITESARAFPWGYTIEVSHF